MLTLLLSLTFLVVLALALGYLRTRASKLPPSPWSERYVRAESEAVKAFYALYADFFGESPPEIQRFVGRIAELTGLPADAEIYPTDQQTLEATAAAFALAAKEVYSVDLSLSDPDSGQIDALANRHLIDPALRPYFDEKGLREGLTENEGEQYQLAAARVRVPREALLYYAMGAFWGEWWVRHQGGRWVLFEPLRPVQAFPDMLATQGTLCIHPFSQVAKKLTDPEGDQLAFKASLAAPSRREVPPFPLTASIADGEAASETLLPHSARIALERQGAGEHSRAIEQFEQAIAEAPNNSRIYLLALPSAWQAEDWQRAERWLLKALQELPRHPMLHHNLAALYSNDPARLHEAVAHLEQALAADPNYGRAHITLASCLLDLGRLEEAIEHATWVRDNDRGLREEAESFLAMVETPESETEDHSS